MGAAQSTRVATPAIVVNSRQPDALARNLKKLGQVTVQPPAPIGQPDSTHVHAHVHAHARTRPDSIDASRLSELLDARKHSSSKAERYHLDRELVQRLAKRYNTPSVGREHAVELPDGDRRFYREAIWVAEGARS